MRNYPLRNKYKQAAKKLAYIVSRISEPPSYKRLYLETVCDEYKTFWHGIHMTEKNMCIFYFTLTLSTWKVKVKLVQSCPTLCNPMNCSLPGSSVHGDSPGKNTGVAVPFSMGSSQLRDWIWVSCVSCIAGGFFTVWATREALKKMEENVKNFVKWCKNNSFIILHKNCFYVI